MGFMEALRRRGEWDSKVGRIIHWMVYFVCLFAGFYTAALFEPRAAVVVVLAVLVFFAWWSSALVGTHMGVNCLPILVLLAVNIGVLQGCIERLRRHRATQDAVIQIKVNYA